MPRGGFKDSSRQFRTFAAVPIAHPAEKQALADLLSRLEHETDIPGVTQEQIDTARAEVARDMGW